MNPLTYVKLIVGTALLATVFFFGRGCADQGLKEDLRKKDLIIDGKNEALSRAALALQQAKTALEGVSANTRAEKARADQWMQAGQEAANAAARDAKASGKRIATLEQQLQKERSGCTEGRAKICGTPLR